MIVCIDPQPLGKDGWYQVRARLRFSPMTVQATVFMLETGEPGKSYDDLLDKCAAVLGEVVAAELAARMRKEMGI